ncbi:Serine/threonine-protein kinase prp4 [Fulvia fulva]|nr:Serine/threonine-protein kinase prp4 [Fulvia fulva]WPV17532.1 Serine/threonine-protein kinase prp4 [Fulvia fulva]WPV32656.1 Serine/threonine-protein kinase prp4 [Fulvia fulva]
MSPRSPLSDGEVSSEDGEKVTKSTSLRQTTDINSSARHVRDHAKSSSRPTRLTGREALMNDRNAHFNGYGQDRDRSRSPFRRDRSGSRSPFRADRDGGAGKDKRRRQDDHYGKNASDTRRHKTHDEKQARGHGYRDIDRPSQPNAGPPYNDRRGRDRPNNRDSYSERDRSRSPFRATAAGTQARPPSKHELSRPDSQHSERGNTLTAQRGSLHETQNGNNDAKAKSSQSGRQATVTEEDKASEQVEEPAEPEKQLSEAELIEQRRKKREAIKKKYAASSGNDSLRRATLESNLPSAAATPYHDSTNGSEPQSPVSPNSPGTPKDSSSAPGSPAQFEALSDADLVNPLQVSANNDDQGQSAADYDPDMDMNEDRPQFKRQDIQDAEQQGEANKEPASMQLPKKPADEFDMFAEDDDDDMFAPADKPAKKADAKEARTLDEGMLDNWDYPDGHYRIINGELLDNRYAVEQQVGKGTFATVVRARDSQTGSKVAIKIACRNDTMLKAGQKEMQFLERLNEKDPEDKRYIIRLLGNFTHKGHLCLVFEGLHMDLRDVLKKFGRDVGINLDAVKIYAYQMFQALLHMKHAEVLHADLKPDNILVNEKRTLIKICDFGTATLQQDAELTPYLVSRFYRAPEVILGMNFDYAIDMWAIGCTLFELYAGRILFNGSDNNGMLRVIQECRGKLPNRLIKRAMLADKYFDEQFTFYGLERDKMTGNVVQKPMHFAQGLAKRDLKSRLSGNINKMTPAMLKEHTAFLDLLDKCLQLDPEKRIKPKDALHHHFFARPSTQVKPKGTISATTLRPVTVQHSG